MRLVLPGEEIGALDDEQDDDENQNDGDDSVITYSTTSNSTISTLTVNSNFPTTEIPEATENTSERPTSTKTNASYIDHDEGLIFRRASFEHTNQVSEGSEGSYGAQ